MALYAGFGLKLPSKRRGVVLARHESYLFIITNR